MTDNITLLNTGDKDEFAASIAQLKRLAPMMKEHAVIIAGIRRASFDAHINEGFTPDQALTLCGSMEL